MTFAGIAAKEINTIVPMNKPFSSAMMLSSNGSFLVDCMLLLLFVRIEQFGPFCLVL